MDENRLSNVTSQEYLSTGQVASLCSVTPDTVLKWVRAGKIPATRTPGGHHRIPQHALLPILAGKTPTPPSPKDRVAIQYCWEFYSRDGKIQDGCRACIVYRSRTSRCYEMCNLPTEAGHARLFCKNSCEDCEYYKTVRGQPPNVLVVTDKIRLKASLEREAKDADFNLRTTDCEYRCSMLIDSFRPDYVVIDCSFGAQRSREFAQLLYEDPRIPFVRIILAGNRRRLPKQCDKLVFAFIEPHFTLKMVSDLVAGSVRKTAPQDRPDQQVTE